MKNINLELQNDDHSGGALLFLLFVLVLAFFAVIAEGAQPRANRESDPSAGAGNTLMLVREWDPENGTLVGWLPIHRAAIQLELVDKRMPAPQLGPNDAVQVSWLPQRGVVPAAGHLAVSPEPRSFEGEAWLPVLRDANLVRIVKRLFLIRAIEFGESKWRLPTTFSTRTAMPLAHAR